MKLRISRNYRRRLNRANPNALAPPCAPFPRGVVAIPKGGLRTAEAAALRRQGYRVEEAP